VNNQLTEKEIRILFLYSQGKNRKEIARCINCSGETVKTHLKKIGFKLESKNTMNAVYIAIQKGILL